MGHPENPLKYRYNLRFRIESLGTDSIQYVAVMAKLKKVFGRNRLYLILDDKCKDIRFQEAIVIAEILGCQMKELADNTFQFAKLEIA